MLDLMLILMNEEDYRTVIDQDQSRVPRRGSSESLDAGVDVDRYCRDVDLPGLEDNVSPGRISLYLYRQGPGSSLGHVSQ